MELIKDGIERKRKEKELRLRIGRHTVKMSLSPYAPRVKLKQQLMTSTIISGVRKRA